MVRERRGEPPYTEIIHRKSEVNEPANYRKASSLRLYISCVFAGLPSNTLLIVVSFSCPHVTVGAFLSAEESSKQ